MSHFPNTCRLILAFGLLSIVSMTHADQPPSKVDAGIRSTVTLRRPCAVAVSGDLAFIANRASGTVSTVDISSHSVVAESAVGEQLSDIVACPGGKHLLATDEGAGKLVVLSNDGGQLKTINELDVPPYPVSISISPDGDQCAIASLWPRQLTLVNLTSLLASDRPVARQIINLKIAPRTQCWISDQRLVVADSFGGKLTVIDATKSRPIARLSLDGHNIRGLTLNADKTHLFLTHQILNGHEPTERQRVFWGDVMGNILRSVALTHITELCENSNRPAQEELAEHNIAHWMFHPLGEPSNAAGDPSSILVNASGQTAVMLSGTNEIALRDGDNKIFSRRTVGRRPVSGALTESGDTVVVANHFDDSVSFVGLDSKQVTATVSLGKQPALTLAQQGEALFYDAHLSLDKWYSCHSCHTDGHTNSQLNDNFGDDSYGAPKRILSLLGVAHTAPWAWNGSQDNLEDQVAKSIKITMQGQLPDDERSRAAKAITAYLRTLPVAPSVDVLRQTADAQSVLRGKSVFASTGCVECHSPDRYTSDETFDMGVADANVTHADRAGHKFNPPSLIGLSQRARLLHDASATSIDEVFAKSDHRKFAVTLDDTAVSDLTAFLRSL